MSHIVTIESRLHDLPTITAACQRLNLAAPTLGTAQLFSVEASGVLVRLPGWHYPVVIDTLSGLVRYDNYGGHWGEQSQLDRFLQAYAIERCRLEARKKGYQFTEQALPDGTVKLHILEGTV